MRRDGGCAGGKKRPAQFQNQPAQSHVELAEHFPSTINNLISGKVGMRGFSEISPHPVCPGGGARPRPRATPARFPPISFLSFPGSYAGVRVALDHHQGR